MLINLLTAMKIQSKDNRIREITYVLPTDAFKLCSLTQQTVQTKHLETLHSKYSSGDPEESPLSRILQFKREHRGFSTEHCHFPLVSARPLLNCAGFANVAYSHATHKAPSSPLAADAVTTGRAPAHPPSFSPSDIALPPMQLVHIQLEAITFASSKA